MPFPWRYQNTTIDALTDTYTIKIPRKHNWNALPLELTRSVTGLVDSSFR
jgi:hypothetical protein